MDNLQAIQISRATKPHLILVDHVALTRGKFTLELGKVGLCDAWQLLREPVLVKATLTIGLSSGGRGLLTSLLKTLLQRHIARFFA